MHGRKQKLIETTGPMDGASLLTGNGRPLGDFHKRNFIGSSKGIQSLCCTTRCRCCPFVVLFFYLLQPHDHVPHRHPLVRRAARAKQTQLKYRHEECVVQVVARRRGRALDKLVVDDMDKLHGECTVYPLPKG